VLAIAVQLVVLLGLFQLVVQFDSTTVRVGRILAIMLNIMFRCVFHVRETKACTASLIWQVRTHAGIACLLILKVHLFVATWLSGVLSIQPKSSLTLEWNSTGDTVSIISWLIIPTLCTSDIQITWRGHTRMSTHNPFSPLLVFQSNSHHALLFWVL